MKKVVYRAIYHTSKTYNEGYICILGDQIEGVFGFDYAKIDFKSGYFHMLLVEQIFVPGDNHIIKRICPMVYDSQPICDNTFYCPETYLLFNRHDGMSLSLVEKVTDSTKINKIFEQLEDLRPQLCKN